MIKARKEVEYKYMNQAEVVPCPFCPAENEGDFEIRGGSNYSQIFCRCCGCSGPMGRTCEDAVEAWNGNQRNRIGLALDRRKIADQIP